MSKTKKLQRVLIMAGGTGGHVFPGLAVARAFQEQGITVFWLGTTKGLESQLVPAQNIPLTLITIIGLRNKNWRELIKAPWYLLKALLQAMCAIHRLQPDLVLGMGGFVSGPGGLAAWLLRKPLVIHEQNAIAGLTNRLLAIFAKQIFEAFSGTFKPRYHAICTGNPVRAEICNISPAQSRFIDQPLRILVIGGSLGAVKLNEVVPQALALLSKEVAVSVRHQSGQAHLMRTQEHYAKCGVAADVMPFINDMVAVYTWADVVICRAGALTIAELAAVGIASILIPFPQAVDDHQTHNAQVLVAAGGALLIQQQQLTANRLAEELKLFATDRVKISNMAQAARTLRKTDATLQVSTLCQQLIEKVSP